MIVDSVSQDALGFQAYYDLGAGILSKLAEARIKDLKWQKEVASRKEKIAKLEVAIEVKAVEDAGGEKGLGPNQAARTRALAAIKQGDASLLAAQDELRDSEKQMARNKITIRTLEDQFSLVKATLYAMSGGTR